MNFQRIFLASAAYLASLAVPLNAMALPLSPGDRIRVTIPQPQFNPTAGNQRTPVFEFSGLYEVDLDGTLQVPFIDPIQVSALDSEQVEAVLTDRLIQAGLFQPEFVQVSIEPAQWAPVQVTVSGATFLPGRILADGQEANNTLRQIEPLAERDADILTVSGNYPPERYLTSVLRQAGGVKPTADLENIRIVRGLQEQVVDLSGVFTGESVEDVPLIAGDRVIVPELAQIQPEYARPSQITPSIISVFMANQTEPNADTINGQVVELLYGTRFNQAAVSAACAGGTRSTNANRRVALVRTDPVTGATDFYDRKIQDLLREPLDEEMGNPILMPADSVVCYDSRVINITGILNFIGNILSPVEAIRDIFFND